MKIDRQLCISDETFEKRQIPMPDLSDERIFPGGIKVKALFEADCQWRLVEEFGTDKKEVFMSFVIDHKIVYQERKLKCGMC